MAEPNDAVTGRLWVIRPRKMPAETLSSYLLRSAYRNGMTPFSFANHWWPGRNVLTRDIDRDPDPHWLADIARSAAVPLVALQEGVVSGLGLSPGRPAPGDVPLVLSLGIYHRVRRLHGQMFCPNCIRSDPAHFRITWRLGYAFACESCGCELRDACPRCDAIIAPHLSPPGRLDACHRCLCNLSAYPTSGRRIPSETFEFQMTLSRCLSPGPTVGPGPIHGQDGLTLVRSLIGIARNGAVLPRLRSTLGLTDVDVPRSHAINFERARIPERAVLCETVARWMANWPIGFIEVARDVGISARTFVRSPAKHLPAMKAVISQLPSGSRRDRSFHPVLQDRGLARLLRTDPPAYRRVRAARILAAIGDRC